MAIGCAISRDGLAVNLHHMVPLQSHKSQHSSHGACHCAPPHDGTDKGTGADDWAAKNRRASMATTSHHPIIARRSEAAERRALSEKEVRGRGRPE